MLIFFFRLTKCAPNTYTFSKDMSEQVCVHYKDQFNLPIVIYRPSIVTGEDLIERYEHDSSVGSLF